MFVVSYREASAPSQHHYNITLQTRLHCRVCICVQREAAAADVCFKKARSACSCLHSLSLVCASRPFINLRRLHPLTAAGPLFLRLSTTVGFPAPRRNLTGWADNYVNCRPSDHVGTQFRTSRAPPSIPSTAVTQPHRRSPRTFTSSIPSPSIILLPSAASLHLPA